MSFRFLIQAIRDGFHNLTSRRVYLTLLIAVPLLFTLFFINLMDEGVAVKVPSSVVDLDNSSLSRDVIRNLGSSELVDIVAKDESYHKAMEKVRSGKTYGFS